MPNSPNQSTSAFHLPTSVEDAGRYIRHYIATVIGPGASFDHVDEIAGWLVGGITKRPWLLLTGNPGTGKTTILRAIASTLGCFRLNHECKKFVASDLPVLFTHNYELLVSRVFQGNWCSLLLLDDIGTEPATFKDYGREYAPFAKVVEERYNRRLPMIVTSNLEPCDFLDRYGFRTYDRITELATVVTFSGESYRQMNNQ